MFHDFTINKCTEKYLSIILLEFSIRYIEKAISLLNFCIQKRPDIPIFFVFILIYF